MYLEEKFNEKWMWDPETRVKSQGLFVATRSFEDILAFSVVFNCLEPLKPLVTKLQRRKQDIYMACCMIDLVISDLKSYRENIGEEFKAWYNTAMTMAQSVHVQPSVSRLAKGWSRFRSNVENDGPKPYYKRAVAVPFLDDINS